MAGDNDRYKEMAYKEAAVSLPGVSNYQEPIAYLGVFIAWAQEHGAQDLLLSGKVALRFIQLMYEGDTEVEASIRRRAWRQWKKTIIGAWSGIKHNHANLKVTTRFCKSAAAKYPSLIEGTPDMEADCFMKIAYSLAWIANHWESRRAREMVADGEKDALGISIHDSAFGWKTYYEAMIKAQAGVVPRFYISSSLIESFWHTDVNVPSFDVRLPFPQCVILFPGDEVHFGNMGSLEAMVVSEGLVFGEEAAATSIATSIVCGYDSPIFPVAFHMPRNRSPVSEHVRAVVSESMGAAGRNRGKKGFHEKHARLLSLVANFALYTTNMQDDVRLDCQDEINRMAARAKRHQDGSRKRRKLERAIERKQKGAIYIVGVKFESRLGDSGGDVSMRARHVVRGHWRNQPYGPGREFRRQVFIKPHYRGGIPKVNEGAPEPPPKDYYVSK